MRSFAVIAGLAASANAYAYSAQVNSTSTPSYPATSSPAAYYPASSSVGYPVYGASSSAPSYYTTSTVKGLTTVCGPTTLSVGTKTYTITKSTTLVDNECTYTTSYLVKPTPAAVKSSSVYAVASSAAPVYPVSSAPAPVYPSSNATAPGYPAGTAAPTTAKPSPSQFTGAAAHQTGAAMLAVVGALAAFAF
jgi:hypothetical protein